MQAGTVIASSGYTAKLFVKEFIPWLIVTSALFLIIMKSSFNYQYMVIIKSVLLQWLYIGRINPSMNY